jgi:hypothetical protein
MEAHLHDVITQGLASVPKGDRQSVEIEVRLGTLHYPGALAPSKRVKLPAKHPLVIDEGGLKCEFQPELGGHSVDRIVGAFKRPGDADQSTIIDEDRYTRGIRVRKSGPGGASRECIRKRKLAHAIIHQPNAALDAWLTITVEEPYDIETTLKHHVLEDKQRKLKRRSITTADGAFRLDITCPAQGGGGVAAKGGLMRHIVELEHLWGPPGEAAEWTLEKTRRLLELTQTISKN